MFCFDISEGLFLTCSYEYLTSDWNPKSFLLFACIAQYVIPLSLIVFFYAKIMQKISIKKNGALTRARLKVLDTGSPQTEEQVRTLFLTARYVAVIGMTLFFFFLLGYHYPLQSYDSLVK